jgi:hypothetical protein
VTISKIRAIEGRALYTLKEAYMIALTGNCSHCRSSARYVQVSGHYEWECSNCFNDTVETVDVADVETIEHECDVADTVEISVTPELFFA